MIATETIRLRSGRDQVVQWAGSGPMVVWLHGVGGPEPEQDLLAQLAEHVTVVAPPAPGFNDLAELADIDDVHDLALHYHDLLDAVTDGPVVVAGHSFGAMIAAELAAHVPQAVERLVLVSPIGLWSDADPVFDLFSLPPSEVPELLYTDASALDPGEDLDADAAVEMAMALARGMTTVAKFVWPIPDRGLSKRLYRITTPTTIVHGADDAFVPVGYAKRFAAALADASVTVLDGVGHMVPAERPSDLARIVLTIPSGPQ